MAYIALYRKWRPQDFSDVVGQDSIVKTLSNSLSSGRVSHAYLFAGPRGTGKTTVARILAKGLNCLTGLTAVPCGTCEECVAIAAGASLNVTEIDGASNRGIGDVRELRGQVQYTPINARYKVYIIDEVHMLTLDAFNALLKTLEEPPAHVVFIFATTDPHKLPPTILSRVQRYDFQRFTEEAVAARLQTVVSGEGLDVSEQALRLIAQHAEGSMRDALSILEKCVAFADQVTVDAVVEVLGIAPQELIEEFTRHLLGGSGSQALRIIGDIYNDGKDLSQFVRSAVADLRRMILEQRAGKQENLSLRAIAVLSDALREMRFAPDPRIPLEVAALKIAANNLSEESTAAYDLQKKVLSLEKEVAGLKEQMRAKAVQAPRAAGRSDGSAADSPSLKSNLSGAELSAFVLDNWQEFLQQLRQERLMQCEAFLKEGSPLEVVDNNVVIAFPRDRGFHKASIEQADHRKPAEKVLARLTGANLRLKCIFDDKNSNADEEQNGEASEETNPDTHRDKKGKEEAKYQKFIDVSLETFGGTVFTKPKK